ncbi:MAG TPA: hypothetical protein VHZ24_10190 [Pirellulales bacterium]|nr:hypothetical protein [Pirellulales bacterium]
MKTFAYKLAAVLVVATLAIAATDSAQARLLGRRAQAGDELSPSDVTPGAGGPMFRLSPVAPGVSIGNAPLTATPVFYDPATLEPGCAAPVPCCCPTPCIEYRHRGLCKVKCCLPPIQTSLCVMDPCTCCPVNIPVCLPGCCCDAPSVSSRHGLFARGIVTYDWCCGATVTVRFERDGNVLVTYRGV